MALNNWTQTGGDFEAVELLRNPLPTALTIDDVPIDELQSVIDSLPKRLTSNVVINVLPGTWLGDLTISRFSGSCALIINGAATRDTPTHNIVGQVVVSRNSNVQVQINGISANGTAHSVFFINENTAYIRLLHSNVTAGTEGIRSWSNHCVDLLSCSISNCSVAIGIDVGYMVVRAPSGNNNTTIYRAGHGGTIHISNDFTISGTTYQQTVQGGQVINSLGEIYTSGMQVMTNRALERVHVPALNGWTNWLSFSKNEAGQIFINYQGGTASVPLIGILPAGFRPVSNLLFTVPTTTLTGGLNGSATFGVATTGEVNAWNNNMPTTSSSDFTDTLVRAFVMFPES